MSHSVIALALALFLFAQHCACGDSIAAVRTNTASDVVPLWDCWFNTYPAPVTVVNLVFGYNNTQDFEITVAVDSAENRLEPVQFQGYQPWMFKPGLNRFSMVLPDTRNVLRAPDAHIQWSLGDKAVLVDQSMLTTEQRCDVKYEGVCPTWIDGFCDDTLYCNGQESCSSAIAPYRQLHNKVMGRCRRPLEGVKCSISEVCNETERACVLAAPPPPPAPSVLPLLSCWYYAAPATVSSATAPMHVHLVLGYNNTAEAPVVRLVTLAGDQSVEAQNNVAPEPYNTLQPTLFRVGHVSEAWTLVDTLDVLRLSTSAIVWRLTDQRLEVRPADLTDERLCQAYRPPPPPQTPPPTATRTGPPLEVVTPSDPSDGGGEVSDDDVIQCSIANTDCTPYDSYCNGPTRCDIASGYCVLINPSYSPCDVRAARIRPGTSAVLQCVEHASQCVAVQSDCYKDRDCNNGLICDGQERCVNGTCVALANQTVATVCGYANAICIEGVRCVATDQLDPRIVYGIVIGVLALLGAVVVVLFYLRYRAPAPTTKSST